MLVWFGMERNTKHKTAIIAVLKSNHLVTLKELSELLPVINFSTIYRNIVKFEEEGLITKVQIDTDTVAYELCSDSHDHVVCELCHDVQSVQLPKNTIEQLVPAGFSITFGRNIIRGVCKECN